ncbi:hypothetical protein SAMN05444722_1009 [Rhodovulum sp. ES.010]|uniref:hypothetical protein n=1 Tax=Rhodovulum sp. ES.010 TaxID=1882821 RepID=UPI000927A1E6|nr:hypothetical protein [Rhodovulum sp. ES.010]SIO24755.1 hypothetical protein SAMN05444722_1009 [Rhodovulum sp. ES.010]
MNPVANREAIDGVQRMHRGVHMALEELVNRGDAERAAEILQALDVEMVEWINATRKMR